MNYRGYHYRLILSGSEKSRKIESRIRDGKKVLFTKPVTNNKQPKIYIIKHKNEIIYVGYTSQSITSRLNFGLKADGKNGYHGYKWKNIADEFLLSVFVFENRQTEDPLQIKKDISFVEAIEAELVFKLRTEKGLWPEYQNEIHFNNLQQRSVRKIAECIYDQCAVNK